MVPLIWYYGKKYYGNIVTDLFIAMAKFGSDRYDEWWLGTPWIGGMGECLIHWSEGEASGPSTYLRHQLRKCK